MPSERRPFTQQYSHSQGQGEITQARLVLSLRRPGGPLLLLDDVAKVVQLCRRDGVAALDDLTVRALEPDHAAVGRERREWIESGGTDMPPDRFQIAPGRIPSAQAQIQDELIHVRAHVVGYYG